MSRISTRARALGEFPDVLREAGTPLVPVDVVEECGHEPLSPRGDGDGVSAEVGEALDGLALVVTVAQAW